MELAEMVAVQRDFDSRRDTTFRWSMPFSEDDTRQLSHNVLALAGEVGELANLAKKFERGDFGFDYLMDQVPGELADIFIYVLKIAYQGGIDLEQAFLDKVALNERRFPVMDAQEFVKQEFAPTWADELARSGDLVLIRRAIDDATESLLGRLQDGDLAQVTAAFNAARVIPPRSTRDMICAALASLVYARAAAFEGEPQRRTHLAAIIEAVVRPCGLSIDSIASLTVHSKSLKMALLSRGV